VGKISDGDITKDDGDINDDGNEGTDSTTNKEIRRNWQTDLDSLFKQSADDEDDEVGEFNATTSTYFQQQAAITSPPNPPLPEDLKLAIRDAVMKWEEREKELIANGFPEKSLKFYRDPIRGELTILQQKAIAINIKEYMFFRYERVTDEEVNYLPGTLF